MNGVQIYEGLLYCETPLLASYVAILMGAS